MNDVEGQILDVLRELDRGLAAMKAGGPAPDLLKCFERLDRLADGLPEESRELRHYLQRKSYDKARQRLETGVLNAPGSPVA